MFQGIMAGGLCFLLFYGRTPSALLAAVSAALGIGLCLLPRKHTHGAFLSMDVLAQRSRLKMLHAGLKMVFSAGCAFLCVAANTLPVSLFITVSMAMFTVIGGGTPLRHYLRLLSVPALFIILGTVAILAEVSPKPMGLLDIPLGAGYLCITAQSQASALSAMARALGAVSCLYLLSLSTPMYALISALRRARLPDLVIELMYLIYRYIFVLTETHHHMHTAAESRLGFRSARVTVRTLPQVALNLMFLSFRKASDSFAAMEARCYDGAVAFWEEKPPLHKRDILAAVGYTAGVMILWYWTGRSL